jgi:inner membrane protein
MTGKTHIIGGIAASLAYAQFTNHDPLIMVGAGIIGALLPDICHGGSKIGRKLSVLSKIINTLFGHRTFTHSLLFIVIIAWLLNSFIPSDAVQAGVLAGMVSHYVLDMATKNGIKLFFPLSMTVRFPLTTRTGGKIEGLVFSILALLSFYYGYQAFSFYL